MLAEVPCPWSPPAHLGTGVSRSEGSLKQNAALRGATAQTSTGLGLTSTSKKCPARPWASVQLPHPGVCTSAVVLTSHLEKQYRLPHDCKKNWSHYELPRDE